MKSAVKQHYIIRSTNSFTGLFYVTTTMTKEEAIKENGGKSIRRVNKANGSVDTHSVVLFKV